MIKKRTRKVLEKACRYKNSPRALQTPDLGFTSLKAAEAYKKENVCAGSVITCVWEDTSLTEEYNFCQIGYMIKRCEVS